NDGGDGLASRVVFTAPADGVYYLAAGADDGAMRGDYKLSIVNVDTGNGIGGILVTDLFPDPNNPNPNVNDPGTSPFLARSLPLDTTETETEAIDIAGDVDWFAVSLEAGATYSVRMNATSATLDAQIAGVYDANSFALPGLSQTVSLGDTAVVMTFQVETAGVYYIAAAGQSDDTGGYSIRVTKTDDAAPAVGDDVLAGDVTTIGMVEVGSTMTGLIDTVGDRDWIAMELVGGHTYDVAMGSTVVGLVNGIGDPYLETMRDAYGRTVVLESHTGGPTPNVIRFTPDADGTYYVVASDGGGNTGGYDLSVTDLGAIDDWSASPARAGTLSDTASGTLHSAAD
ncbi:MAG: hypothetical protein ACPGFC_12095, partial [Paracoccaceae bacterium]